MENWPKELTEKWTWDGNNLSKISNADGTVYRTFEYEKDRISKILWNDGAFFSFFFNGKFINKIEYRGVNGELFSTYNFKHTKDKVTTITIEKYIDDLYKKDVAATLRLFLPIQTVESLLNEKRPASLSKGETYIVTVELKWDRDNIKTETTSYERKDYSNRQEITYKYDKNINPYYNFFGDFRYFGSIVHSKNNEILAETVGTSTTNNDTLWVNGGTHDYYNTTEYDIIYDGKWPTEIFSTFKDGTHTSRLTTYYVYEK